MFPYPPNSGGILTVKPKLEICPHCGQWRDLSSTVSLSGDAHLIRLPVEDDKDKDLYLETCMVEIIQFIGRNMHSRFTDSDGNPKP